MVSEQPQSLGMDELSKKMCDSYDRMEITMKKMSGNMDLMMSMLEEIYGKISASKEIPEHVGKLEKMVENSIVELEEESAVQEEESEMMSDEDPGALKYSLPKNYIKSAEEIMDSKHETMDTGCRLEIIELLTVEKTNLDSGEALGPNRLHLVGLGLKELGFVLDSGQVKDESNFIKQAQVDINPFFFIGPKILVVQIHPLQNGIQSRDGNG